MALLNSIFLITFLLKYFSSSGSFSLASAKIVRWKKLRTFPNDRVVYPMYEKALELEIPVMVHTGPEPKPLYSRHCQPVYVDDVAADFPDLDIILAHAGLSAWWQEAAGIASVTAAPCVTLGSTWGPSSA